MGALHRVHVYMQRINASGAVQWTANGVQVDAATTDVQSLAISPSAGNAIVFYSDDNSRILGQRLDGSGSNLWSAGGETIRPSSADFLQEIVATADSASAIASWGYFGAMASGLGAQYVDATGAVQWGAGGTTLWTGDFTLFANDLEIAPLPGQAAGFAWVVGGANVQEVYAQRVDGSGTPVLDGERPAARHGHGSSVSGPRRPDRDR